LGKQKIETDEKLEIKKSENRIYFNFPNFSFLIYFLFQLSAFPVSGFDFQISDF